MVCFPKTIEHVLHTGGYTGVEQLLLRHLLPGEPLTLRELSHKTGKSTGSLDRAVKKLLVRRILQRATVNEQQKFTVAPAASLVESLASGFQRQRTLLERQEREVRTFFTSLSLESEHPALEHVRGIEGIAQLLRRIASVSCPSDVLHVLPQPACEDDTQLSPLYDAFHHQRSTSRCFARVLVPSTRDGLRFRERDALRFRATRLLPQGAPETVIEKLLTDELVVTINHASHTGMVLRSRDLAAAERSLFEALWLRAEET